MAWHGLWPTSSVGKFAYGMCQGRIKCGLLSGAKGKTRQKQSETSKQIRNGPRQTRVSMTKVDAGKASAVACAARFTVTVARQWLGSP